MKKGGILIISKDDANIYNKLQIALTQGKPVLWYETPTECYYIDTISGGEITTEIVDDVEVTTYGDIILTKGGKTITITDANVVTESGDIQNHLYKYYVDYDGEDSNGNDIIFRIEFISVKNYDTLTTEDLKNELVSKSSLAYESETYQKLIVYDGLSNNFLSFILCDGSGDTIELTILDSIVFTKTQLF